MRVGREVGGDHVRGDREFGEEPAFLAVLRKHGDARGHGVRRAARAQLAAVHEHAARLDFAGAEDRLADLRAPGPDQTMWQMGRYTSVNHAAVKMSTAENFIRSANAPTISAGVMIAKVNWKQKNTDAGIPVDVSSLV